MKENTQLSISIQKICAVMVVFSVVFMPIGQKFAFAEGDAEVVIDEESSVCTITLVSGVDIDEDGIDDNTTVVEKDGARAVLINPISAVWNAVVPGAFWIWGDNPVAAPVDNVAQTFVRTFGWYGDTISNATLFIASDDSHSVDINGNLAGADPYPINFTVDTQDEYDVTSLIVNGMNTLSVNVLNHEYGGDPTINPAGLMYKLVITGTGNNCDTRPTEKKEYSLDITMIGDGLGNVMSDGEGIKCYIQLPEGEEQVNDCSEIYPEGTEVTLTATPNAGSNFDSSWTVGAGTCTGNTTPCTVTVNSDLSLTAHFSLNVAPIISHGGHSRKSSKKVTGEVLGESTSTPEALSDVADMPVGAPNTGAGGTSPVVITLPTLSAILNRKVSVHNAK